MLIETIAIGILYGFFLFEWLGLVVGGLVAPGYMALYFDQPIVIALCIGIGLLTMFLVRCLSRVSIIYGRRRFIISIIMAFALQWTVGAYLMGASFTQGNIEVVGYIIPGLLALNIATLAACDVLKLKPTLISSVGASTYGANIPHFTWLDMEARLYEKKLISNRSQYASLGGIMDTEGGIDGTGISFAEASIVKHGAFYLQEGTPKTVIFDVQRRMQIYTAKVLPAAFINVGGNVTALGWVAESALVDNGFLQSLPYSESEQRGLIFRMYEKEIPVIHLLNIERLAARYNLPNVATTISIEWDVNQAWRIQCRQLGYVLFGWFLLGTLVLLYQNRKRISDFHFRTIFLNIFKSRA